MIGVFSFQSCKKDFLEVPITNDTFRQDYVKDLNTLDEFLNGIYLQLSTRFFKGYFLIYPDLVSDNVKPVDGSDILSYLYRWAQQSNSDRSASGINDESVNMNSAWFVGYRIIRDCNFVLEQADSYKSQNAAKADQIKGQAYAIRGFIHFMLCNVFSQPYNYQQGATHLGIPYVKTSDWSKVVHRESVASVYEDVINDFNTALSLMTLEEPSKYRFNRRAIIAALSRVFLYKGDFLQAKNMALVICREVPLLSSYNYPEKLFTTEETEAVFQLPPAWGGSGAGNYYTYFAGFYYNPGSIQFSATEDIAKVISESKTDKRNDWIKPMGDKWIVSKYPSNIVFGFPDPGASSYYQTIIRSSEMYLTAAEAYSRLNKADSAQWFLDKIRMRADSLAVPTTVQGEQLNELIYTERRKEFAFEGARIFDLLRLSMPIVRKDVLPGGPKMMLLPNEKAIAPIPVPDVELSNLQQNPGY
ncbi:SusD family protein [Chitinophaga sp. YR627]|nr:SusD family protein [Chitinophaga sp. YR627]